jgi:23S rRNA pseudouridine2605 synthase
MRLQKYLANAGVASRRKSEELILAGKIKINGEVVIELGTKVNERDVVEYNGEIIKLEEEKRYILLNKPKGYVTTVSDEKSRKTVMDLLKDIKERVYPVGRLDFTTEGLLILTNDGDLTYKVTHPKHELNKVYKALVKGHFTLSEIKKFENGLEIDDYVTSKAKIEVIRENTNTSFVEITIHEGKNRQVRKMCESLGHRVLELERIKLGKIDLTGVERGKYRFLTEEEIKYLKGV